ncbi:tape measure protein [Paraglaciecola chathamensis]|uniref:tape measure protein n=1 Tax=Paraglaciecola chathamensis TaxID=368405 RepID=UPI003627892E
MAKTYTIKTQLDGKDVDIGLQKINSLIKATTQNGNALNKALKVSGDMSKGVKSTNELKKALSLAEDRSKGLRKELAAAKLSGASANTVADLTAKLKRSDAEAQNLKNSLKGVGQDGGSNGVSMLTTFSKIGNVVTGIKAGIDLVGSAIGKVTEIAGNFGKGFVAQYDAMAISSLTLKNTLADGEKGLREYNAEFEKAPPLVRAQKKELDAFAATISSYSKVTGKEAFAIANAVNAVGDSVGATMEQQQGFTTALGQAMTAGKLMAQDFNQMSQTALGTQFKTALINAANEMRGVGMSSQDLSKQLQEGKVKSVEFSNVFGSDWTTKMAAAMQAQTGLKTSVSMVNDALKNGKISTELFAKVLGDDYLNKLLASKNATQEGAITQENFRQAMEDGAFSTDVLNAAIDKFIQKGETLPQTFNTFAQVREAVTNGFYTGAVEGFMSKMVDSKGTLNEFGTEATNFATGSGKQLGEAIGIAADKVRQFIEANGGMEGIFVKIGEWTGGAISAFKQWANDILIVIGNFMGMTKSQKELEAMGFTIDQTTGMVNGWRAVTQKMKDEQAAATKKVSEGISPLQDFSRFSKDAAKGAKDLGDKANASKSGLDNAKRGAEGITPSFKKAAEETKKASDKLAEINRQNTVVDVNVNGAVNDLNWLRQNIWAAQDDLRSLQNSSNNYRPPTQFGGRSDTLRNNPYWYDQGNLLRASELFGSLEYYNATTAAQGTHTVQNNSTSKANIQPGAVVIQVNGGDTDKAVKELVARLRRLGITV